MVILATTAFMALGLLNLDFGPEWARGQRVRLGLGLPLVLAYVYFQMPPLVFPQALSLLLLTLIPNALYTATDATRRAIVSRRVVSVRRVSMQPYGIALGLLGAFTLALGAAPIIDAGGLRDVAQVESANSLPPDASLRHVRVVPEQSAIFAGEKVVGQLGSYYQVGSYDIQVESKSDGSERLVWVAPLEYQGVIQWLSRRTSPGVLIVSAEDPNADAELRRREPMRYIPSALLNENLYRHVYMRYGTELILDTTLQLDDHGDPQYICTLGRPTIGWSGERVSGVAIVDPATGSMRRVDRADFGSLPHWVRRVYPPQLALSYNEWFGLYAHGFWNALLARRDVHVPARDEVFGLLADRDAFVWFVDHTSPMRTDRSMTGFTYMDALSGKITYYTSTNGQFNSAGAEYAVASNPIVRQGRLMPTQPILYNVYEHNTWVIPLVAPDTGKYQTLALVEADNGRVVIGNPLSSVPQTDAFAQYAAMLGVAGMREASGVAPRTLRGVLDRIATAPDGTTYFTLRGDARPYAIADGSTAALLARAGDRVTFRVEAGAALRQGAPTVEGFVDAEIRR